MQIKELNSKKLFKEFEVIVPGEEIESQIDVKIKEIAPKSNLPGFRPGKAPINLIKKKYEKDILGEIINQTIQEKSKKLLEEKKLTPLRMPKIEIKKFEKLVSLEFIIQIDLQPEIKLCDLSKIKLIKYTVDISKKEIDESYKKFLDNQSSYIPIKKNRAVKKDDQVNISFECEDTNISENLRKQENINVIIGSTHQILPNLDKTIVNKKAKKDDEFEIIIKLPSSDKPSITKDYKFKIKIKEISEIQKIKVDEEFLKKIQINSFSELKKKIEDNLRNQYSTINDEIIKKQLLDNLEKEHNFDLPEGILKDEFDSIWKKVDLAKKEKRLDPDDVNLSDKDLKNRYEKIASRRVKLGLLVTNIANTHNIEVTNEEISSGLTEYAKNFPNQEKQVLEYFKKNPSEIEVIRGPIFEKKTLDFLLSKVKQTDKKVSVKELHDIQTKIFKQK